MDMATFKAQAALNRRAYAQLRDKIQRDYAGQYVALANGELIGAASTFDAARALVRKLAVLPEYYLVFPATAEPDFELVYDLFWSV